MKNKYKITLLVVLVSLWSIPFLTFSQKESDKIQDEVKYYTSNEDLLFDNEDFGDAPEGPYPTTLFNNGARHTIVPGILMGNLVDPEPDGQPGAGANCDDLDCLFPSFGDDEDGVVMPSTVTPGTMVNLTVSASIAGFLDAWMDFNLTNGWADAGEHIFISEPLSAGMNSISFNVPASAITGQSYVRFRFRSFSGAIGFDGLVSDGEVEDYIVTIEDPQPEFDYGDAPDVFHTLLANNGARHTMVPGIYLGSLIDMEMDGQPGINANCDDNDCLFPASGDDEDGVSMPAWVTLGATVNVSVAASVDGYLDAWFDFNRNNDWNDPGEHIYSSLAITAGANILSFIVPATADTGLTYARFRFRDFSSTISYDGSVQNGEVEDYAIFIETEQDEFDFGDAPEDPLGNYPTTLAFNGARHIVDPAIFMGSLVDPDPDGQPGSGANCDDMDCLFPSNGDDEDGVILPAAVSQGSLVFIPVTASVDGFLDVWFDINQNNSWADPEDHIMDQVPLVAGLNTLLFSVPVNANIGQTYMRFRFRDYDGAISYDGLVQNGEVEDYSILINESSGENLDFGDAPDDPAGGYPTILSSNGARHTIVPGIYLGNQVDSETDGQPSTNANCDDNDCFFTSMGDDEDGVTMPSWVVSGTNVNITVSASIDGYLDAWFDFNGNDSWADAGEHVFISSSISAGSNVMTFNIPATADTGIAYARFRFRDFNAPINFDGLVTNGEVEDYALTILENQTEYDFGDAPENSSGDYPTTLAYNGARHLIVPGIYLGGQVDPEPDGQPNITADCDDMDCQFPSAGDDEDGILLPDSVSPGEIVNITVLASVDGCPSVSLSTWFPR